jgi:hypothetical protein
MDADARSREGAVHDAGVVRVRERVRELSRELERDHRVDPPRPPAWVVERFRVDDGLDDVVAARMLAEIEDREDVVVLQPRRLEERL